MSVQEKPAVQLSTKCAEISALLEAMIVELELRGCEKHDKLIKRAMLMQKQLKELQENA
jgi:hypothetical protein